MTERMHDHRLARRDSASLGTAAYWLAVALGIAACTGAALDACGAAAQQPDARVHGIITWRHHRSPIGESDLLTLARMVVGSQTAGASEAGRTGRSDAASCRLWTATNRFVLQRDAGIAWRSVGEAARAYSTALAPRWSATGWCAQPEHASRPLCDPHRLARRARISTLSWATIGEQHGDLRGYLRRWARGDVPPPAGCDRTVHTDGLSRRVTVPGRVRAGSNWAWPDRRSRAWPDGYVRIVPASSSDAEGT